MYRAINRFMFTLAALAPAAVSAQDTTQAETTLAVVESPEPLVLHTFSLTTHERVSVTLLKGQTYRVELESRGIRFQVKPAQPGMQRPRVQELLSGSGVAGSTLSLIQPLASGDYFIETVGGEPGRPVRLTVTLQPMKAEKH